MSDAGSLSGRRIAIVGAGLAGLTAARQLAADGGQVTVFEKSRGVGGRMATRREGDFQFDHGAQYFTVRDRRFRQLVEAWRSRGLVASWRGRIAVIPERPRDARSSPPDRMVALPGMSALGKAMSRGVRVRLKARVERVEPTPRGWRLNLADGGVAGEFDALVLALPAPQAAKLLEDAPELRDAAASVRFNPCLALMAGLRQPCGVDFDAAFVNAGPLAWICRNSSKPARAAHETWVLHASADWSGRNIEAAPDAALAELWRAFEHIVGAGLEPEILTLHKWRYALAISPLDLGCLWDPDRRIAACGDWCHGSRIEGAYLSGLETARQVRAALL